MSVNRSIRASLERARLGGFALAALPFLAAVVVDAIVRRRILVTLRGDNVTLYALGCCASVLFWASLVRLVSFIGRGGSRSRWNAWLALAPIASFYAALVGGQAVLYARFEHFLSPSDIVYATSLTLPLHSPHDLSWALLLVAPLLVPISALFLARRASARTGLAPEGERVSRRSRVKNALILAAAPLVALLVSAMLVIHVSEKSVWADTTSPPDIVAASALGMRTYVQGKTLPIVHAFGGRKRTPEPRPSTAKIGARNIIVVLSESVRFKSSTPLVDRCASDPTCTTFTQFRSLASTTPASLAQLVTGKPFDRPLDEILEATTVFDVARSLGMRTGYISSQTFFFGNVVDWLSDLPIDRLEMGYAIDPAISIQSIASTGHGASDAKTLEHATEFIAESDTPALLLVQLSNTHFPYAPIDPSTAIGREHELYEAAVQRQAGDMTKFLSELGALPRARENVVVFVSDHGEQFYEHSHYFGHVLRLFDEEVHVPLQISGEGLRLDEREKLREAKDAPSTFVSLFPTLLDLMGASELPTAGTSLFHVSSMTPPPSFMANCTPLWCFRTPLGDDLSAPLGKDIGAISGMLKAVGPPDNLQCHDLARDPDERENMTGMACEDLKTFARDAAARIGITP